jgi:predicted nucleic acid-binding protein
LAVELWQGAGLAAASILSYPEGRAALAAAHRGGRLGAAEHGRALAGFEEVQRGLATIGVDHGLARHAGELAEELNLRGYDAVHLATALELADENVALVTWDADLSQAAERAGLGVAGI